MNVTGGSTDVTTYVALTLLADGTDATGLTITDLDLQYVRSGAAPAAKVDATALAATDSAHADNKAIEIDATDQPGLYRVDWPDAAFAAGVKEVILSVKHTSCKTAHLRVTIDAPVNVTKWNGTSVPSEHTAGYPIVTIKDGTGTGELDTDSGTVLLRAATEAQIDAIETDTNELQTDWANGGRLDLILDAAATAAELAKVPKRDGTATWNATALASIQSEANDALVAYDPPTNTEMEARTLAAASYATAANQATIASYIDTEVATLVTNVGTILSAVDTEVAAIKTKTDQLTFTTANKVDAKLTSDGLDNISASDPGGVASTWPQMVVSLWRRFFKRVVKDNNTIKTYADDGTTVRTTQTISDTGVTQTQGGAS